MSDLFKPENNDEVKIAPGVTVSNPKSVATGEPQNVTNNIVLPKQEVPTINQRVDNAVATVMENQVGVALDKQEVKEKIEKATETIVDKKVNKVINEATGEENESASELEEEALSVFGYKPGKSIRKWQTKWAGYYHAVLSAIWMTLAMFTVGPIIFVAKKVHTAGKVTWFGIVLGVVIYALILVLPWLPKIFR